MFVVVCFPRKQNKQRERISFFFGQEAGLKNSKASGAHLFVQIYAHPKLAQKKNESRHNFVRNRDAQEHSTAPWCGACPETHPDAQRWNFVCFCVWLGKHSVITRRISTRPATEKEAKKVVLKLMQLAGQWKWRNKKRGTHPLLGEPIFPFGKVLRFKKFSSRAFFSTFSAVGRRRRGKRFRCLLGFRQPTRYIASAIVMVMVDGQANQQQKKGF